MNRNEFNRFIAGGALPGPGDLEGLRELTVLFPWFHSAHMLLLRGLKENADIRFDTQLKASALSVSDREVLYHYLFMQPAAEAEKEKVPHEEVAQEEVAQEEVPHEEFSHEEVAQALVAPPEEVAQTETPHEEVVQEAVDQETFQEEAVHEEVAQMEVTPATEAETSATEGSAWRTREELMAEIEARLEELSSLPEEVHEIEAVVAPDAGVSEIEAVVAPDAEVSEIEAVVAPDTGVSEIEAVVTPDAEVSEIEAVITPDTEVPEIDAVITPDTEVPEIEALVAPDAEVPGIEAVVAPDTEVSEIEALVEPDTEVPVTSDITEQEPAGEELLELVTDNESPVSEQAQQLTPQDLIDRFIQSRPTLERIPLAENQPVKDLSEPGTEEQGRFITETLAKIYINQGYYTRAINIYEKLSLQFPEKSAYFAGRIEKIKDLIK